MLKEIQKPNITAYQALLLIFSQLGVSGRMFINRDEVTPTLYGYSEDSEASVLFEDIVFRENTDSVISKDIDDALAKLMTFGALGYVSPTCDKLIVLISDGDAQEYISEWAPEYVGAARKICGGF